MPNLATLLWHKKTTPESPLFLYLTLSHTASLRWQALLRIQRKRSQIWQWKRKELWAKSTCLRPPVWLVIFLLTDYYVKCLVGTETSLFYFLLYWSSILGFKLWCHGEVTTAVVGTHLRLKLVYTLGIKMDF